jgi:ribosomal protein S18 acetylase RimI-like enzyme
MDDSTGRAMTHIPSPAPLVRRGVPADAAMLASLAARTFQETFGAQNRAEDMAEHQAQAYGPEQQARELGDPAVITLISEIEGAPAGYAMVRRGVAPPCVSGHAPVELWRFYVDAPFHGRGVAQVQMRAVENAARELGGSVLWLGVWEHNPRAIAFYRKCGFRDVGAQDFWLGSDQQTDRVMMREIAGR